MNTVDDVCLTWNEYPNYVFTGVLIGPDNSFVFKFTNCHNNTSKIVHESRFWDIYAITSKGISKPAGFVFVAKGAVVVCTEKAVASCNKDNSKAYIGSLERTNPWSFNGLDLIQYEGAGEVITDLCTIMGVDVTVDQQGL